MFPNFPFETRSFAKTGSGQNKCKDAATVAVAETSVPFMTQELAGALEKDSGLAKMLRLNELHEDQEKHLADASEAELTREAVRNLPLLAFVLNSSF